MTTSNQEIFDKLKYNIEVDTFGNKCYYNNNGDYHREDGPAVESLNGNKSWWINGQPHREDGPAVDYIADGYREWWNNGRLHRLDGAAIEYADGCKEWYINGKRYSEEEFNDYIKSRRI